MRIGRTLTVVQAAPLDLAARASSGGPEAHGDVSHVAGLRADADEVLEAKPLVVTP